MSQSRKDTVSKHLCTFIRRNLVRLMPQSSAAVCTFLSVCVMQWSDCCLEVENRFGYNFYKVESLYVGLQWCWWGEVGGDVVLRGLCYFLEMLYYFLKMLYYFLRTFLRCCTIFLKTFLRCCTIFLELSYDVVLCCQNFLKMLCCFLRTFLRCCGCKCMILLLLFQSSSHRTLERWAFSFIL